MKKYQKNITRFVDKYQIVQIIANSQQKTISLVQNSNHLYLVSKKYTLVEIDQFQQQSITHQISILKNLKHPNIIKVIDVFYQQGFLYSIQQYCEEGDLSYHIDLKKKKNQLFTQDLISNWIFQILSGLKYIHEQNIIHRDIKTSNIFLTAKGNIKVGSFSISKVLKNKNYTRTIIGTPIYMSPEMLQNKKYDFKTDIWSLGCLIYQVCTLKKLFSSSNILQLANKVMKFEGDDIPNIYSQHLKSIIKMCLEKNPNDRPTADELLKTPYFLRVMQKFIQKQGIILDLYQRIPIKRYKIHEKLHDKLKKNGRRLEDFLPSIELKQDRIQKKKSITNIKEKEYIQRTPILRKNSQKKYSKQKSNSKQRYQSSQDKRQKKQQKQLEVRLQINKIKLPEIPKPKPKNIKNVVVQQVEGKVYKQKPPQVKSQNELKQDGWDLKSRQLNSQQINIAELTNKILSQEFSNYKKQIKYNSQKKQVQKSVFESLIVRQDDETNSIQKYLDEVYQTKRLTIKGNEIPQLLNEYKSKFEEVVKEMYSKYKPNMQTIKQRTNEFDSNQFVKLKEQLQGSKR